MRKELGNVLKDQFQIDPAEALFGFHVPPFTTVKHLHMHGMGPVGSMGFLSRMIFRPNSMWFNTVNMGLISLLACISLGITQIFSSRIKLL